MANSGSKTNTSAQIEAVLKFWFGRVEETIVPSEHRAKIWFGEDPAVDEEIRHKFSADLEKSIVGDYDQWEENPRGQLALIIMYDQFSRHIFRNSPLAYSQDNRALEICKNGMRNESEHSLSLIERVFYYFPLLHAEDLMHQERSVRAYHVLSELAFAETRIIYDSFAKFANHHYSIIRQFGRFPQRNNALGRVSSVAELNYLKEIQERG